MVKDSTDGQVTLLSILFEGSMAGQGLNGWLIHFLEIRKMKMMFVDMPMFVYHVFIDFLPN